MEAAKWAKTRASSRSVLANRPRALAKSRTCRGLTITTGKPTACKAWSSARSRPPVASNKMRAGRKLMSSVIKAGKFVGIVRATKVIIAMFRFTTAGESHGRALVAIVEGLPAGLPVDVAQRSIASCSDGNGATVAAVA
jgi:hypothetical protein